MGFFFGEVRVSSEKKQWALLAVVLGAAAALLACGLPGGFVLDDYANLSGLSEAGGAAAEVGLYLVQAPSGFPGRPIAYLSFFAQHASWPHDPQAFKLVNIAVHLVNGMLAYAVVSRLMSLSGQTWGASIALIAAGIWLIHPIQVSTVLYVVQRMTELAAFFCLCGVLAYLKGRALAAAGKVGHGYAWMSAAVALGTPLAILAKENGALLPLYLGVIELTLLARVARPAHWEAWAAGFLVLPLAALASYIAFSPGALAGYSIRDFDMAQRLYTEAGILWDYLAKIVLPRPRAFGIYFDDYPVARAPWESLSTAAALAGWCAALAGTLLLRRKLPFLSFAILWFLAGHALESTVVPLELYFEHRNYLPLLGPVLFVAWGTGRLWEAASSRRVRLTYASLGVAGVAALGAVTWVEARTWSDPVRQTVHWAREHPASQRAQYELGSAYAQAGRYAEANETFERAQALAPEEAQFLLSRVFLTCQTQDVPLPSREEVARNLAGTPVRPGVVNVIETLVFRLESGSCPRVDPRYMLALVDGFLSNPHVDWRYRRNSLNHKARLHALLGDLDGAVRTLEAGDEILPNMASVQLQVTWLASAELYDEALRAIEKGRRDIRWPGWQRALYAGYFDAWERQVREAARDKGMALRNGT